MDESHEIVIVGGGIAGLTAAWHLRDREVLLLEASETLGGRIRSFGREPYWVSVGPHLFPGPESELGKLIESLQVPASPVTGKLTALAHGSRLLLDGHMNTYPFRLPISLPAKLSLVRAGLKLRWSGRRFSKLAQLRQGETSSDLTLRLLEFIGDQSFGDYLGKLHPEAEEFFRTLTNRGTAEPEEVSAGNVAGLLAQLWNPGSKIQLGRNLRKGPSDLVDRLRRALGNQVRASAQVTEVDPSDTGVRVSYTHQGETRHVDASYVIVATLAHEAKTIVKKLPGDLAAALAAIPYGPLMVAGVLTREKHSMEWDDLYSMLVVRRSFNMFFHHSQIFRAEDRKRRRGSALMLSNGATPALRLMDMNDSVVRDRFLSDLYDLFPEARGQVEEVLLKRWEHAAPFNRPGRHRHQRVLERAMDRVLLAGDYLGHWVSLESAAQSGAEAARRVQQSLDRAQQNLSSLPNSRSSPPGPQDEQLSSPGE